MNVILRAAMAAAFVLSVCATNVSADTNWFAGIKAGSMNVDSPDFSNATNIGVVVGYNFSKNLAVEGELTTSSSDGTLEDSYNYSIDTYALYAAGRWGDKAYFKVKGGFLNEKIKSDYGFAESDSGFSAGIGGGYRFSDKASLELEYTKIETDVDFISLGFNYAF